MNLKPSSPASISNACAIVFMLATVSRTEAEPPRTSLLPPAADVPGLTFVRDIKPILGRSCVHCHGSQSQRGDLRVDSVTGLLRGGDSGASIVVGNSAQSYLVRSAVRGVVSDDEIMPPFGKGDLLTAGEVGLIRAWIDQAPRLESVTSSGTTLAFEGVVFGQPEETLKLTLQAGTTDNGPWSDLSSTEVTADSQGTGNFRGQISASVPVRSWVRLTGSHADGTPLDFEARIVVTPSPPALAILFDPESRQVQVQWKVDYDDWTLEMAEAMANAASWKPATGVQTGQTHFFLTVSSPEGSRFLRLRKP